MGPESSHLTDHRGRILVGDKEMVV